MLFKIARNVFLSNIGKSIRVYTPQLNLATISSNNPGNTLKVHCKHRLLGPPTLQTDQVRHKFDKRRQQRSEDDDEDATTDLVDFDHLQDGKDNKITRIKLTSLRADMVIKSGLGMARNKVEATFYDSKIRINGKKISKKSVSVKSGDEIDVIKELSPMNPEHLVVARIEILSVQPNAEDITLVLRRFKSLTIENYPAENAWRHHAPSN